MCVCVESERERESECKTERESSGERGRDELLLAGVATMIITMRAELCQHAYS